MPLEIISFTQGPAHTNAYLIADPVAKVAAAIDPSWDGAEILAAAEARGWRIAHIWFTHAHFDHIGGAGAIADALNPLPLVALHPADHDLWKVGGNGAKYGFTIDPGPEPTIDLYEGQTLLLGDNTLTVHHTPGHTPGHVIFVCAADNVCFCGDLIFAGSVGRTDLPGGSHDTLIDSIDRAILTLPDETRLLSGHGRPTTVGSERVNNPFL